jgi:hypothetical protein
LCWSFLKFAKNSYLTNYGQKKILLNNIQDLGLLMDNRHV